MTRPIAPLRALAVCLALLPAPLAAGPWERAEGTAFLSFKLGAEDSDQGQRGFAEVYGEMGWARGLVPALRVRLDGPLGADGRGDGEADLRLRWHPNRTGALALGLEGGVKGETGAMLQDDTRGGAGFGLAAVHLGHGLDSPWGPGWARLTLSAEEPLDNRGLSRREAMVQLGLRTPEGWLGLASLSVFERGGDRTVKFTPAVGRSLGGDRDLLLEVTVERGGAGTRGVALSFWQAF